jgi:dihydroorotase-like cyclic amidohydrolase
MLPAMLDAVAQGKVTLADLMHLLCLNAATRFGLSDRGAIAQGRRADLIVVDLGAETHVTETSLITAAAPIARLSHGEVFRGRLIRTLLAGQTVWHGTPNGPARGRFVTPRGPQ